MCRRTCPLLPETHGSKHPASTPGNQATDSCRQPHSLKTAHLARRPGRWGPSPQDDVDPSDAHHRSPHPQMSACHLPTPLRVTYQHPSPTSIPQSPVLEPVEVTEAVPLVPRVSCILPTLVLEPVVPPSLPPPHPRLQRTHKCGPGCLTAGFTLPSLVTPASGFPWWLSW